LKLIPTKKRERWWEVLAINTKKFIEKLKLSQEYINIKSDLNTQLKYKKADTPTFLSQVNDYMAMWTVKELLIMDIEERGAYIQYDNGGGQKGTRKNDSVADQIKVNAQMLKLLDALDIRSTNIKADDDDEEM